MRLGVDIRSTFTNVALDTGATLLTSKVLTTPNAPECGVMTAFDAVLAKAAIGFAELVDIAATTALQAAAIEPAR
jgi:N-methylhydantoinase A